MTAADLGFDKDIDSHVQTMIGALNAVTSTANQTNAFNRGGGGKFMYYKKGDNTGEPGYIVIASAHPSQVMWNVRRGMVPLYQFGEFEDYEKGTRRSVYGPSKFDRILEMGGAALFPETQIVENNWDRTPPLKGFKWPQMEGKTVERLKCSYCQRDFLTMENLQSHESIKHTTTSQQTSLARHLADANKVTTEAIMESVKALHAQNAGGNQQIADALSALVTLVANQNAAPAPPAPAAPAAKAK